MGTLYHLGPGRSAQTSPPSNEDLGLSVLEEHETLSDVLTLSREFSLRRNARAFQMLTFLVDRNSQ